MASRSSYPIADGRAANPSITANGSYPDGGVDWAGGTGSIQVTGVFGGATAKLQLMGEDGVTALDIGQNATFTTSGLGGFIAPPGKLMLTVSGASGTTNLKAWVSQIA